MQKGIYALFVDLLVLVPGPAAAAYAAAASAAPPLEPLLVGMPGPLLLGLVLDLPHLEVDKVLPVLLFLATLQEPYGPLRLAPSVWPRE